MDTELRKRIEKAADDFSNEFPNAAALKIGFLAGAEHGYEEAITLAKEWMIDLGFKVGFTPKTIQQCITDFEKDMLKFLEEKK